MSEIMGKIYYTHLLNVIQKERMLILIHDERHIIRLNEIETEI